MWHVIVQSHSLISPAAHITSRHVSFHNCWQDAWCIFHDEDVAVKMLKLFTTAGILPTPSVKTGGRSSELWEGTVWCVYGFFFYYSILQICGLMSVLYVLYWWLRKPECVCVCVWVCGFVCVCMCVCVCVCGYTFWYVCLLQEWSLLLITGCDLVI